MDLIKKISHFVIILSVSVPLNVYAVRFSVDGDARAYPDAVAGLETQIEAVEGLIQAVPLAAQFPYLHLLPAVKGANGFLNYLDISADVLISQAPENIRKNLRKMYFEGHAITETNEAWRISGGKHAIRSIVSFTNGLPSFHVQMVEDVNKTPTLKKFLRLLAIVEITNATIAYQYFEGRDYRLYHRILDAVNQISLGLMTEEILRNTTLGSLKSEMEAYKGPVTIQATLEELILKNQLQVRMTEVKRENYRLKDDAILNWVNVADGQRDQKSKAILSLSAVDEVMDQLVTQDILERSGQDQFTLIREATARGDSRMVRLLKKHGSLVISGGSARCDYLFK